MSDINTGSLIKYFASKPNVEVEVVEVVAATAAAPPSVDSLSLPSMNTSPVSMVSSSN